MPCQDSFVDKIKTQRLIWTQEFNDMASASTGGLNARNAINSLLNEATGTLSDRLANFNQDIINDIFSRVSPIIQDQLQSVLNVLTFADEMQIAMFHKLASNLADYTRKRLELTQEIKSIVVSLIEIFQTITPQGEDLIVQIVKQAYQLVDSSYKSLSKIEMGMQKDPPIFLRGSLSLASSRIEAAVRLLTQGSTSNTLQGLILRAAFEDLLNQFNNTDSNEFTQQRDAAGLAIMRGLDDLMMKVPAVYPEGFIIGRNARFNSTGWSSGPMGRLGLQVATGTAADLFGNIVNNDLLLGNNTIKGLTAKMQSLAAFVLNFPIHVIALQVVATLAENRITMLKDSVNDVRVSMGNALASSQVANGNYQTLYMNRVSWALRLGLISEVIGNSSRNPFAALDDTTANLYEDYNRIKQIITFLGTDGYIDKMDDLQTKIEVTINKMLPSILAGLVQPRMHAKTLAHLADLSIYLNRLIIKDSELLYQISRLNVADNQNPLVNEAMGFISDLESRLGNSVAKMFGFSDGTAMANLFGMISPIAGGIAANTLGNLTENFISNSSIFGDLSSTDLGRLNESFSNQFNTRLGNLVPGLSNTLQDVLACKNSFEIENPGIKVDLPSPELVQALNVEGNATEPVANAEIAAEVTRNNISSLSVVKIEYPREEKEYMLEESAALEEEIRKYYEVGA